MSASVMGTGGGIGVSSTRAEDIFDIGIEIGEMLAQAADEGKKIMIGVDDVSKTPEMVVFASEFGKCLPDTGSWCALYRKKQSISGKKCSGECQNHRITPCIVTGLREGESLLSDRGISG